MTDVTRRRLPRPAALVVVVLATLLGATGCPHRPGFPGLDTLTDAQATARVHQAAARRARMVGTVKARLPGLEGVVMSANVDVAVEPTGRLSVAVRSFFEQPQQMLVTDGSVVTVFDATTGAPVFKRGPVNERAVSLLLPIPLWPHEVVEVFLARPPDGVKGRLMGVDEDRGTFDVWFEPPGNAPFQVTVRASDDAIVRWQHFRRDGRPSLDVTYADLRRVGDAVMPFSWTLTLVDRQPEQTLVFVATDVIFNGEPLPDAAFRLDPPPNMPLQPL